MRDEEIDLSEALAAMGFTAHEFMEGIIIYCPVPDQAQATQPTGKEKNDEHEQP